MDILKYISESLWHFFIGMYPEIISLFLRWTLMMIFLCLSGQIAKQLYRQGAIKDTIIIQILGALISISVSFSVSIDFIHRISEKQLGMLILCSVFAWILLPYLVPKLLIKSFGYQIIARRILYIAEITILCIQIITCICGD